MRRLQHHSLDDGPIVFHFRDSTTGPTLLDKVRALRTPTPYPSNPTQVTSIETHMAWVFLTDRRAYKLKKPIRSPHFDYTSCEARREGCQRELRLNRRLARDIYLTVVALREVDGELQIDTGGRRGAITDWLVEMKRLPAPKMLDRRIERNDIAPEHIDALASRLGKFYRGAESADMDGTDYRRRHHRDIDAKSNSLKTPTYDLDSALIDEVSSLLTDWLDEHRHLIEYRARTVVDAHGDLRPEHICIRPTPVVIDCLEFERQLRLLDPISELSFLDLECRRLGNAWIGPRLLSTCIDDIHRRQTRQLQSFYGAYHALVRATIAIWHLDGDVDSAKKWRNKATWYLREVSTLLA